MVTPRLRKLSSDTAIESVPSATTLIGPSVLWQALVPMAQGYLSGLSDKPFIERIVVFSGFSADEGWRSFFSESNEIIPTLTTMSLYPSVFIVICNHDIHC
jgi:hypothetical protein